MTPFILALLRALTTPMGSSGEFLSTRRKSHLLQAEWYAHLAEAGEAERKNTPLNHHDPIAQKEPVPR